MPCLNIMASATNFRLNASSFLLLHNKMGYCSTYVYSMRTMVPVNGIVRHMNKCKSIALSLLFLIIVLTMLSQLPLIVGIPIILIWPFISIGTLIVDGYARLIAGASIAIFTGWKTVELLPKYIGTSGLVQYGEYMVKAQFHVVVIVFIISIGLSYAGVRSLNKEKTTL